MIGELSALITAVLWTGSSLAFAAATRRAGSVYVNVTRMVLASFLLAVLVAASRVTAPLSLPQWGYLLLSGVAGLVLGDTYLFKSYEFNSARISSLVMSTSPAMTAALGYFALDESLSVWTILGIAVTLGGIALVILGQKDQSGWPARVDARGVWYALLGSAGQAGGLVLAKLAFQLGPIHGLYATLIRVTFAALLLLPLNAATGRLDAAVTFFRTRPKVLGLTLAGAVLGPVLGITFSLVAVAHTTTAVAATLMATVPLLMLPAARLVHREHLSWEAIAGAVLAVLGVCLLWGRAALPHWS